MNKHILKPLLIGLVLFMPLQNLLSKNARAFVVTNTNDTILGEVKLSWYNKTTGGIHINGFDIDVLHYEMYFRELGKKGWKLYHPSDIKFFTFVYRHQTYEFRSFVIERKSIYNPEKHKKRFLLLLHNSKVKLYKDVRRNYNPYNEVRKVYHPEFKYVSSANSYSNYFDYYLYNTEQGLTRAIKSSETFSVLTLLDKYGIEKDFLNTLPKIVNFKDLKRILKDYAEWSKIPRT